MRRSYIFYDFFYRLTRSVRRNRLIVLLYALICVLFAVVGVAVGVGLPDKTEFVLKNGASIFKYLRGESGVVACFFGDLLLTSVYCLFTASMFIFRTTAFLSIVPCIYQSYVIGMNVCNIITVFSVSALPMLSVVFVPACILEVIILCILSFGCFTFAAQNCGSLPTRADLKEYYKNVLRYIFVTAAILLVKAATLALFGAALIGVV